MISRGVYKKIFYFFIIIIFVYSAVVFFSLKSAQSALNGCFYECDSNDPLKCNGNFIQECKNCDADPYLDWCNKNDCTLSGLVCKNGACAVDCSDNDGDGFGNPGKATCPNGAQTDCDDTKNYIKPGATETCDIFDNDCDTFIDEGCDDDGDLYCDKNMQIYTNTSMCTNTVFIVNGMAGNDCDDTKANANPGTGEGPFGAPTCSDLLDNNCNGSIDAFDADCVKTCVDNDNDGYGDPSDATCDNGPALDCDNANSAINPGATEIFDCIDNDCDGSIDEGTVAPNNTNQAGVCSGSKRQCVGNILTDNVFTGVAGYETIETSCDAKDNDCNGSVDTGLAAPNNTKQAGVCAGSKQKCSAGAWADDYSGLASYQNLETSCDAKDNDCDGSVDNELVGPLNPFQANICSGSRQKCVAGVWTVDYSDVVNYQSPEISCDNIDNDCNAIVDDGLIAPNNTKQAGVCVGSKQKCAFGVWVDNYIGIVNYQSPETSCSDGIDNDCDGVDLNCCGNFIINSGETCDGINFFLINPFSSACRAPGATSECTFCGDGINNGAPNEQCDAGSITNICNNKCQRTFCGDGVVQNPNGELPIPKNEQCDNGKQCDDLSTQCITNADCLGIGSGTCTIRSGDGCDANCQNEGTTTWVDTRFVNPFGDYIMNTAGSDFDGTSSLDLICQLAGYVKSAGNVVCGTTVNTGICSPNRITNRLSGFYWNNINLNTSNNCMVTVSPGTICGGINQYIEKVECKVLQLDAGFNNFSLAIKDGRLFGWGRNNLGQASIAGGESNVPANSVSVYNDWKKITAGSSHGAGIRSDGSIWTWGTNSNDTLGDSTRPNIDPIPKPVSLSAGNWVKVSAGNYFTAGLLASGEIKSWGSNAFGKLGIASFVASANFPRQEGLLATNWTDISAGYEHVLAINSNLQLYSWGDNSSGQLGDGTWVNKNSPTLIGAGFTSIAAGDKHSLAIRRVVGNMELWAWGDNSNGQLGNGTIVSDPTPKKIGNFNDWVRVFAGGNSSFGLRSDGKMYAWGDNLKGQLGLGATAQYLLPTQVNPRFGSSWVNIFIAQDGRHTLGMKLDESFESTGEGLYGKLGWGSLSNINNWIDFYLP